MNVYCNGNEYTTNAPNIFELIKEKNLDPAVVVAELNKRIIKKEDWESAKLNDGDQLELISFVGGG